MQPDEKILIIDDHPYICTLLQKIFAREKREIHTTGSAIKALKLLDSYDFDAVLCDIHMPVMSGLVVLEEIKRRDLELPVLMITGDHDLDHIRKAMKLGAYDYITKPFDRAELLTGLSRAIDYRDVIRQNREYQKKLENLINARTRELQMALMRLEHVLVENRSAHLESVVLLCKIAEFGDVDTGNHFKRISCYCDILSKAMKMPAQFIERIAYSSPMHDIGKLFVDAVILRKPGRLTVEEFEKVKLHPLYGGQILENVSFLEMARDIALAHHENYDGSGYPHGKKEKEIPIAAKIVAICDVFDALVSKRSYKEAYTLDNALEIIEKEAGKRFDPEIVKVFCASKSQLFQVYQELKD